MNQAAIEKVILKLATARGTDKTICPSEVAREMFGETTCKMFVMLRSIWKRKTKSSLCKKARKLIRKKLKGQSEYVSKSKISD